MEARLGNAATVLPNYDVLLPVIRDAAARVAPNHMAADLEEIVFQELLDHPARFDPSKSKLTTYINTIAKRRAIDMMRREQTRRHRETIAWFREEDRRDEDSADDVDVNLPPAEYAAQVYRRAMYVPQRRRGRARPNLYTSAQMAAISALRARGRMTAAGTIAWLQDRRDIQQTLRLTTVPSARNFQYWLQCREFLNAPNVFCANSPGDTAKKGHMSKTCDKAKERSLISLKRAAALVEMAPQSFERIIGQIGYYDYPTGKRFDPKEVAAWKMKLKVAAAGN